MRVPALLLLLATLAGCATPDSAPTGAAGAGTTHPWGIDHCTFVIVDVPVDDAKLTALLPKGFQAQGRPLDPRGFAAYDSIALDAYRCKSGVTFDGNVTDISYGSHYAAVRPPAELREPGYDAAFVKWDPLVPDAPRRDALAAAGMRVHDGTATIGLGTTLDATLSFKDGGGFHVTGTLGAPSPQGAPLPFMEFTPLANGSLARWHARLHDASIAQGQGFVEIQTPWVRDLVGADRAPATLIAGTWNLDQADVAWD